METYTNTATLVVIALGLIVAILQLGALIKQISAQHDWNRRSTALSLSFFDDPQIFATKKKLAEHLSWYHRMPGEISMEEIEKAERDGYKTIRGDINHFLMRLEHICVAMKQGVADEIAVKDILKAAIVFNHRLFRPYIEYIRKQYSDPQICEVLEHYAKKWSSKNINMREPTA